MSFAVRTELPPATLTGAVRSLIHDVDPQQPLFDFNTLSHFTAARLQSPRLHSWLLTVFSALALVLASVGIYAVMHTLVTQRTREIDVRMALGAPRGAVQLMMLRQGTRLILSGTATGTILAAYCSRFLAPQLFQTEATDLGVFFGAVVIISLAALAAIFIPAHRATKVDPIIALRAQ
ncbi:MAG: FtsX-like permease family protein [Candidatus Synoicihabitans palmerolidicus]|nr:FtsX-like permease family protein [Candidatus Synoicihabitans palmerolidicus]